MSKKKNKKQKRAFANPCAKGKFFPCQFGKKKAFSLVEVLVVIALVLMMTGVVLSSYSRNKKAEEVEIAANETVVILRSLQNDALNGKMVDGVPVCEFRFQPAGGVYNLKEVSCANDLVNLTDENFDFIGGNGGSNISISGTTIIFNSPRGDLNSGQIKIVSDGYEYYVCVQSNGSSVGGSNIFSQKGSCS